MNRCVLHALCLVTLSYVQLGQSQCDVVRITAAVYEALKLILNEIKEDVSILNEMKEDISSMKSDIVTMKNTVSNHTSKLLKMNETLTKQIINNSGGLKCGDTWGWRLAVHLDMTDTNTSCPSGWPLTAYSKRTCGRASTGWGTCDSVFFPVSGGPYSQVCGRIRAYQYGQPDAFRGYNIAGQTTIDSTYVSGVAVMHGFPRQHIWTFANGAQENETTSSSCPCDSSASVPIPPFVGEDYFCESGYVHNSGIERYTLHSDDILWDGRDCHSSSTCCSLHNPPYFTKILSQTTTDNLELRICLYNKAPNDNIAVELVEFYVK